MDPMQTNEEIITRKISSEGVRWQKCKQLYPNITMWWEGYMQKHLQILLKKEQSDRNKDFKAIENHLYQCIDYILRSDIPEAATLPTLQKYKAKIVRLNATRLEEAMLDNDSKDKLEGEEPSLFHIIKMAKRRETREKLHVQDQHGNIVTRQQDILITFLKRLRQKYQLIQVDNACITKL
jgi:hypothetical protein